MQDEEKIHKPVYFISKVLQGAKIRYQAIEKVVLVVVFTAPQLRHYFQSFTIILMSISLKKQVFHKPNLEGRMVIRVRHPLGTTRPYQGAGRAYPK